MSCHSHRLSHRHAITLIEVMISLVLISTILLVSLTASANLQRNDTQRRTNNSGQDLCSIYLNEITAMEFRDHVNPTFGLEADEDADDRTTFDDIDDYHNYSESSATYRDGVAIEGFGGWSVAVTVTPATPDATGVTTSANTDAPLRVAIVTCTSPIGETVTAGALVSDVPSDAAETTSYERWRRIEVQFPSREINVTAPLRNQPDPIY